MKISFDKLIIKDFLKTLLFCSGSCLILIVLVLDFNEKKRYLHSEKRCPLPREDLLKYNGNYALGIFK